MQVLKKITQIFGNEEVALQILTNMQSIVNVVICGGCVQDAKTSSDVDVFIINKDKKAWNQVMELFGGLPCQYRQMEKYGDISTSIIEVTLSREIIPFQIIYTDFKSSQLLLESFDFDYVRIGIESGNLIFSNMTEYYNVQNTRHIHFGTETKYHRFLKAIHKGFKTIVFCNELNSKPHCQLEDIQDVKKVVLSSFKTDNKETIDFSKLCIDNICLQDKQSKHLLFPVFEIVNLETKPKYATIPIYVESKYIILPVIESNCNIGLDFKIKDKRTGLIAPLIIGQTYVALVELAILKCQPKIMCYIVAIHDQFLPIPISPNFWKNLESHLKILFPRFNNRQVCAVFQSKIAKWEKSPNEVDILCSQIGSLLIQETKKPEPNYQMVKYSFQGHSNLTIEKDVVDVNDAEEYIELQHDYLLSMMNKLHI